MTRIGLCLLLFAAGCGARTGLDERFDPGGPHWDDPASCGPTRRVCASGQCYEGDCIRRVFITSTEHVGVLGGLDGADALCEVSADSSGLGGLWKAWLSDPNACPSTRFSRSRAPYVLLDGHEVAADWHDLTDGTLLTPICVDEHGSVSALRSAWTNTNDDGTWNQAVSHCDRWSSLERVSGWGQCSLPGSWTSGESGGARCDQMFRLYCFEQ